jgi:poly(3-hydroxybutyrate) depolymerase
MKLDKIGKEKMQVFKPPRRPKYTKGSYAVFLAGSIEMGKAEDWQTKVEKALADAEDLAVFNPRRDDWDNSWKQTIADENFLGQVEWEHDHLVKADLIFVYFDPETKSPISMMELGLFADRKDMIVVCPDGFWRKGNVEFICKEYTIPLFNTLDAGIAELLKYTN